MEIFTWQEIVAQYLRSLGWIVVSTLGFGFAIAVSLKIFNWFSKDINEWEEIKKGNWAVAMILTAIILVAGALIYKVM